MNLIALLDVLRVKCIPPSTCLEHDSLPCELVAPSAVTKKHGACRRLPIIKAPIVIKTPSKTMDQHNDGKKHWHARLSPGHRSLHLYARVCLAIPVHESPRGEVSTHPKTVQVSCQWLIETAGADP